MSRPYPLPELNLVALPGYTDDKPIDAWGLQIFREADLSKKTDNFWVAHLLAKHASLQWTDHLTTPLFPTSLTLALSKFLADKVAWQVRKKKKKLSVCLNNITVSVKQLTGMFKTILQLEKPVFNSYVNDMYGMYLEYDKPGFTEIKSQMEALNATKSKKLLSAYTNLYNMLQ